jgi:hypothetical protein
VLVPLPQAVLLTVSPVSRVPCVLQRDRAWFADRSVLKRNADEIALPPDHATLANGAKIVEAQFEIQRQQIEGVEFDSGPGIRHVLNAASEDTALRVKEQQRVFRNRRPRHISAFEFHRVTNSSRQACALTEAGEFRRQSTSALFVNNQFQ